MQRNSRSESSLLRVVLVVSVVFALALFSYVSWQTYREIEKQADAQITQEVDIAQDNALTLFQTSGLAIQAVDNLVEGMSDEQIASRSEELGDQFRRLQRRLAPASAIWLIDANGHPLANSRITPNPRGLDVSRRDYFLSQRASGARGFVGSVRKPLIPGPAFLPVSERRPAPDGSFKGVVVISFSPTRLENFYAKLDLGFPGTVALLRADGAPLVSQPATGLSNHWEKVVAAGAAWPGDAFTGPIMVIGDQYVALRKVGRFPIFVAASVRMDALRRATLRAMAPYLIFAALATLALVLLALAAMRNAKRLYNEEQRRELAEAALKRAQRLEALGQLTGGVAHDINNLLMIVGGNAELARKGAVAPRQQQRLAAIADAVERGRALTRQLLTFSRRQSVDPISTDLRDHLGRSRRLFEASLGSSATLRIEAAPDVWYVRVDRDELDVALVNLVVNAKDATPDGGVITIEAKNVRQLPSDVDAGGLRGSFVALAVKDQGVGMSPEIIERAFEPFFTTKPNTKGSGLGLSQVYGFCQQAGGVPAIHSVAGAGATVTLYLPRCEESPPVAETTAQDSAALAARSGHVLLVEDNVAVGELTRDHLEDIGFDVTWAQHADAALEMFAASSVPFRLVVSDIIMPGAINGVQLARNIRRTKPDTPILLMTGYAPHLAGAAGDFPILRKPFTRMSLEAALARAFQSVPDRSAPGEAFAAPSPH